MSVIRCTKKLQREMGLKSADLSTVEADASQIGSWHANLIFIGRRKCVLFVNDRTLFNFIAADVGRDLIRQLSQIFQVCLSCILHVEQLPQEVIEQIMAEHVDIAYGSTNNRSVLGSMNDLAYNYESMILRAGGVHSAEVPAIIHKLNRMPMRVSKQCIFPIGELRKLYAVDEDGLSI